MSIEIVQSSPEALELAKSANGPTNGNQVYPFDELQPGQSFRLKLSEAKLGSIQSICSRKSKNGKLFKMIKHEALDTLEVARIR